MLIVNEQVKRYVIRQSEIKLDNSIEEFDSLYNYISKKRKEQKTQYSSEIKLENPKKAEYFEFDPNKATSSELEKLGLKAHQIKNIISYREAGGQFNKPKDLEKIYSIHEKDYELLEPYIKIEVKFDTISYKPNIESKPDSIELNSVDSLDLLSLPGIGPSFAHRILTYRNLLGGFHQKQQVMEVYGFTKEKYDGIIDQIFIDTTQIELIELNTCSLEELKKHPYISYYEARGVISYRDKMKVINSLNELVENKVIKHETMQKMTPYVKFD